MGMSIRPEPARSDQVFQPTRLPPLRSGFRLPQEIAFQ
jgi:hypothetical protein